MPQSGQYPTGGDARADREAAADQLRQSLIGSPESRAQTIARLGGPKAVAGMVGRSVRTVQRWASGQIRTPKQDAALRLGRADVRDRLSRRGINVDDQLRPRRPLRFQGSGHISVKGPSETPEYSYNRHIGPQAAPQLDENTVAGMLDRLGRDDQEGALQEFERFMTRDYTACGDIYDPETGAGLRFDTLTDARFYTDAAGEPLW